MVDARGLTSAGQLRDRLGNPIFVLETEIGILKILQERGSVEIPEPNLGRMIRAIESLKEGLREQAARLEKEDAR